MNKFDGMYEYMGYVIYNAESNHIWDIEPLTDDVERIEKFKQDAPSFKTLAQAKKWIRENQS